MFDEDEQGLCEGKYSQFTSKKGATDACEKDDSCHGVEGTRNSSSTRPIKDACDDDQTVFHLCKRLKVGRGVGNLENCFLKKRYGKYFTSLFILHESDI